MPLTLEGVVGWGCGHRKPPGVQDRPARSPMFSAAARSVGGAAWAQAETFSLSPCSEQAVRGWGANWHRSQAAGLPQGRWERVSSATRLRPKAAR